MSRSTSLRSNSRRSLWHRIKSALIANVPKDIAICEFDCSKNQCTYGEWATCQRRIDLTALSDSGNRYVSSIEAERPLLRTQGRKPGTETGRDSH